MTVHACMQLKKGRRLENEKFFELKSRGYRDGIYKTKRDKIGMGYESLHIMEIATQWAMPTS